MLRDATALIVPLYFPEREMLAKAISLSAVVDRVILVNDGGVIHGLGEFIVPSNVAIINMKENHGIARALNVGLREARVERCDFFLTLDQDSTVLPNDLRKLLARVKRNPQAIVAPSIQDARPGRSATKVWPQLVIQSGLCFSSLTIDLIGDFDESLVIDGVDFDFCFRAIDAGVPIEIAPDVIMAHRLGRPDLSRELRLGGRRLRGSGHPASRRYFMARNFVVLARRYGFRWPLWFLVEGARLFSRTVLAGVMEPEGVTKVRATLHGLRDGLAVSSGAMNSR